SFIGQTPPKICYDNIGNYNVTLYVSDGSSQNTLLKTAYISIINCAVKPTAKLSVSDQSICPNECINFTDKSTDGPTSWSWSFPGGTPASSTAKNPSNICYNGNPGTYTAVLTATNAHGSDTESVKITVNDCPKPVAKFTVTKAKLCYGECINFTNTSTNADYYIWSIQGPHKVKYDS